MSGVPDHVHINTICKSNDDNGNTIGVKDLRSPLILFVFVFCFTVCLQPVTCRQPRHDAETQRIRLLFLGWVVYPEDVTWHYQQDPLLDMTGVPLARRMVELGYIQRDVARRSARIYMPRTYEHFVSSYDAVFLEAMDSDLVTPTWKKWFSESVVEAGLGLCMSGGWASFGGYSPQGYPPWGPTSIGEILPVECLVDRLSSAVVVWMDPVDENEPLISSLPWESAPPLFGMNYVLPRPGSTVIANSRGTHDEGTWPLLSYWDTGGGRVLCFTSSWLPSWGVEFNRWEYTIDFASYIIYFIAGIELPENPELVHVIRTQFSLYREMVDYIFKLSDLIEGMGVSTGRLLDDVSTSEGTFEEAQMLYRQQEYELSLDAAKRALEQVYALEQRIIDLKNSAFLWIYLIEWLVVTSTLTFSGTILWMLMVKRRLYKAIRETRMV
jgi:uncharacterized membrane protein